MKLTIVGGGAASTPNLFAGVWGRHLSKLYSVVLIGKSIESLTAVCRAIRAINPNMQESIRVVLAQARDYIDALRESDVILIQARYGGYTGRSWDESFPLKYNIAGDEGLGPGGLAAAWRSWPELSRLLQDISTFSRHSSIILLTSPVSLLTRCAKVQYPHLRIMGICELPWTTLKSVCSAVGCSPGAARFNYAGVNHLGWLYGVFASGRDVVAAYSAVRASAADFPTRELIDYCSAIPLKYLRLHYEMAKVVAEQQQLLPRTRGAILATLNSIALQTFRRASSPEEIETVLALRPAPWYEEAVAPMLAGLAGSSVTTPVFLSVENNNYVPVLGEDDLIEAPHRFEMGKLVKQPNDSGPPHPILGPLRALVKYERLACAAVLRRSKTILSSALAIHPWVAPALIKAVVTDITVTVGSP